MRALRRSLRLWLGALAGGAVLALFSPASLFRAAALFAGGASEGAISELSRARREQALIRAEDTALMLRVLRAAPTLPEGRP